MFNNIYEGKKVLVTGNTGFKGSWLTSWLLRLGADVIGVSKDIPTNPSMFEILNLKGKIKHYFKDLRDKDAICEIICIEKPDFIFHLAAQAIVSVSYADPLETFSSNVMGTANVLDALKQSNHCCCAVIITSDKCYDNVEWVWGYKETDALGGKDVYSGSKGAAELVIKSYYNSFFSKENCNVRISIGRAGNVIGGGDWAKDRIVADCMRAWSEGKKVEIRSPKATRPWQHVLEPLSGYLALGISLYNDKFFHGEAFNFGPRAEQNHTVVELLKDLSKYWDFKSIDDIFTITGDIPFHEAGLLKLNCDKALFYMKWQANLNYLQTMKFTSEWYYCYYKKIGDIYNFTMKQIDEYERIAKENELLWVK